MMKEVWHPAFILVPLLTFIYGTYLSSPEEFLGELIPWKEVWSLLNPPPGYKVYIPIPYPRPVVHRRDALYALQRLPH